MKAPSGGTELGWPCARHVISVELETVMHGRDLVSHRLGEHAAGTCIHPRLPKFDLQRRRQGGPS